MFVIPASLTPVVLKCRASFLRRNATASGLRSLAKAALATRAAGSAMGPTPQHRSSTTSSEPNESTSRLRSVPNREFQYTFRKSNSYATPFSCAVVTSGPANRPPSPANTSIANVRNGPPVSPVLFTTVFMFGSLSNRTAPIKHACASCSGDRKFKCAICPAVSKPVGTTTSLGKTRLKASSALNESYPNVNVCVMSEKAFSVL
mmetsp:Transcript_7309/g.31149  ORF Transcript_7309/g.31149 Transcript_7309/m.31149 type:complete len:204 (-) Transcript_7309:116-727(-)